jgi:hypothetical protein
MVGEDGYEVRVRVDEQLDPAWAPLFGTASLATARDGTTTISGHLPDQAAVHGLLLTLRDLGLSLISVRLVALDETTADEAPTRAAPAVGTVTGSDTERRGGSR